MKNLYTKIAQVSKLPNIYIPLIASLFINGIIWFILIWRLPLSVKWIPLHYNTYLDIDWIGPWIAIFIYPLISLLIVIVNFVILLNVFKKEQVLSTLINFTSLIIQVVILIGLLTILIKYFV